jgi:hypothetical protein
MRKGELNRYFVKLKKRRFTLCTDRNREERKVDWKWRGEVEPEAKRTKGRERRKGEGGGRRWKSVKG